MRKIIIVDGENYLEPVLLNKSKKLFKTIWSTSFSLERLDLPRVDSLIISEKAFTENIRKIQQLPSNVKVLVISSCNNVKEICDATIQPDGFCTKLTTHKLEDLNLWLESEELVVKCNQCGTQTHWKSNTCYACGSERVEMALGRNLIE